MEGIIKIPNILSKIIKNINEITVPKKKNKTKGISSVKNEEEGHFDLNMKPKKLIAEKYNYKYFMKLNGELNPAEFMNILIDEMEQKYNDDCLIEKSDEKLKLTVKFVKKKCEMNIKLYKLGENEHIVVFDRKNDEDKNEIFYDYISEIKDIIRKIFE